MAENKFSPKYLGKWIVYQPGNLYGRNYLNRVIVAYCIKETTKQLKCIENRENKRGLGSYTVQKKQIISIVPEEKVQDIRKYAKELDNEYRDKSTRLYDQFQNAMLNFPS